MRNKSKRHSTLNLTELSDRHRPTVVLMECQLVDRITAFMSFIILRPRFSHKHVVRFNVTLNYRSHSALIGL